MVELQRQTLQELKELKQVHFFPSKFNFLGSQASFSATLFPLF